MDVAAAAAAVVVIAAMVAVAAVAVVAMLAAIAIALIVISEYVTVVKILAILRCVASSLHNALFLHQRHGRRPCDGDRGSDLVAALTIFRCSCGSLTGNEREHQQRCTSPTSCGVLLLSSRLRPIRL